MNQVRIHGDPFRAGSVAAALRAFLRLANGSGMRTSLCLSAVVTRPAAAGARTVSLADGVRTLLVATDLAPEDLADVCAAASAAVAATAPVVVFAEPGALADVVRLAELAWPLACRVLPARDAAPDLLRRVRAELRWAGTEDPPVSCDEAELRPWLALPPPPDDGPFLHVGWVDPADGTDIAVVVFAQHAAAIGRTLRVLLADGDESAAAGLRELWAAQAGPDVPVARLEIRSGPIDATIARDCAAIVQPMRALRRPEELVRLLASGRPVVASRFHATAAVLGPPGSCMALGGRHLPSENGGPPRFQADRRTLGAALRRLSQCPQDGVAIATSARRHVLENLACDRPAARPAPLAPRPGRPVVVLEAPFFAATAAADTGLQTAAALLQRGNVELQLVASGPFQRDLGWLRAAAPELVGRFVRAPVRVDLWLSGGWPVRTVRPECGAFALFLDWEYGALPVELCPVATQEADFVIVPSLHVHRTLAAAGRPMERLVVVPHGVDPVFHPDAVPSAEVVDWKGARPAVLFRGGFGWRQGLDLLLSAALSAHRQGIDFCIVVGPSGAAESRGAADLRELVQRFQATPGAPELLLVDGERSRAELAGLQVACDLLCHPYRSEGFGLPVLEARAAGLPVLVTAGGACDDFLSGPGVVRIPARRRDVELPEVCVSQPWVLEPDAAAAARLVGECLRDLPRLAEAARGFAANVRAAYPWASAAQSIERMAWAALGRRRGAVLRDRVPVPSMHPVAGGELLRVGR